MSACSHKRKLALPKEVAPWSLPTLREKLVKIGAKVVHHGRYITVQLAEVAIPRSLPVPKTRDFRTSLICP